jgi:CheY-like chemotaxis protein
MEGLRMAKPVLIVDDSQDDEFLCRHIIQKVVTNPIMAVRDGRQAIDYLGGNGIYKNREAYPLPGILLLDLKMPKVDGFAVLEWLKTQPNLQLLVIVLSLYGQTKDINRAYTLGAHSFLLKPLKQDDVVNLTRHFTSHWEVIR